jgi:hypothetical protein
VNPWDVVTWFSAVTLGVGAVLIFAFFCRDAKDILRVERRDTADSDEPDPSEARDGN